jgi:ABC-type sugar transport system substrate-binding protein
MSAPYVQFFEQWGRTVEYEFYTSTGSDEAQQRADAVAIADRRPFAAIVVPGGTVLQTELAAARILVIGTGTNTEGREQSPYRWGAFATDNAAAGVNTGEFVAKSLAGRPAKWAGDASVRATTRKIAVLYPEPEPRLDFRIDFFNDAFRRYARRGAALPTGVTIVPLTCANVSVAHLLSC